MISVYDSADILAHAMICLIVISLDHRNSVAQDWQRFIIPAGISPYGHALKQT